MKPHLVLVHSFPTNSILLRGLEEFLSDFFIVHFIDLPGFTKDSKPLEKISIDEFSHYLDQQIERITVNEYVVGGISFGFLIATNAHLDRRCRAILAIEPYINATFLRFSFWERQKYRLTFLCIQILGWFHAIQFLWKSKLFELYLRDLTGYTNERVRLMLDCFDPHTFFSVAKLLTTSSKEPRLHALPYFLIGNHTDRTVDFSRTIDFFRERVKNFSFLPVSIEHYPKDLSRSYFQSHIPVTSIQEILSFLNK